MTEYIVDMAAHNAGAAMALCDGVHGEIVRCRDCEYGLYEGKTCCRVDPWFDDYWFGVEPDGYCAWGERRSDGQL